MTGARLNIVIPMAGAGSRFARAGYADPKPLIPIHGVPMIQLVIANLRPACDHRFIFVCQRAHVRDYELRSKFDRWAPGSEVVEIDGITDGAAVTVLKAEAFIDNDEPLMIANSDQWVDMDIDDYLASLDGHDGLIMTMKDDDPKWSYVEFAQDGSIQRVVEKVVVSTEATVGIYNFARGADFVRAARRMIAENNRSNNEFYVAPAYDYLIAEGQDVVVHGVGDVSDVMFGLGIPDDLEHFLSLETSARAVERIHARD